ncbi:MAG: DCC1-like thiol-disulfide oxidoreductase family protein [Gemmatimonadota bacterium]|nr:DCC1-like thiol-disulfide oxidoreductase family protein [Gemmatimonadota bacterium]MDE2873360.1 DCC1-like thiol-disulfide oxidoreductase family protein [Gemmatimonadota bacterium]
MNDSPPVVLFDGDCSFCSATVRWTIERDPLARLRFAPLRSAAARRAVALADPHADFDALPDTIVLADEGGVHTTSTAVLRMARHLRFPYPALSLALLVPRPVRDAVYRVLARNRYRWFGRSDDCPLPPPGSASRFLHEEES